MTMRKILALTSCLLTTLGLLLSFDARARAQEPLTGIELQRTLAYLINKWTTSNGQTGACQHKLHLIVYLGTNHLVTSNFWTAFRDTTWPDLLQNYFQPGDKIDLVSFGNRCVPAQPASQTITEENRESVKSWFFDKLHEFDDKNPREKGTLPEMAQLDALKQGSKASRQEDVLILVFAIKQFDGSEEQNKAEAVPKKQLPDAIRAFTGEFNSQEQKKQPEHFKVSVRKNDPDPSDLFVWHYFRKSQGAATNPERSVWQASDEAPPTPTPQDNSGKLRAVAVLLLLIPLAGLAMMKSTVQVTVNNVPRDITVAAWETIPVRVSLPTADHETVVELMLANMPQTPLPIGEIDARTPGVAVWKRRDGYLAEGAAEGSHLTQSTEVPLPYGVPTTVQVWTDFDQPGLASKVSVQPARWMEGKSLPIVALATCWLIALVLLAAASKAPVQETSTPEPNHAVPVCSGGSSVS